MLKPNGYKLNKSCLFLVLNFKTLNESWTKKKKKMKNVQMPL